MAKTHRDHYVAYPWCPDGIMLHMRDDSFEAAFCGSFPAFCDVGPRMDMESALFWFDLGTKAGIVYW